MNWWQVKQNHMHKNLVAAEQHIPPWFSGEEENDTVLYWKDNCVYFFFFNRSNLSTHAGFGQTIEN